MAKCDYCGSTIIFGGRTQREFRFCSDACSHKGFLLSVASQVPQDTLDEQVKHIRQGACPKCGGPGPVDVQTSYRIWSALFVTQWRTVPQISCVSCGTRAKLVGFVSSTALGWWGFPWGLLMTPVQIVRNLTALAKGPHPYEASPQLRKLVALDLAAQAVETARAQRPPE